MWLNDPQKLWSLLYELVACPSFSGSRNERDMAQTIHSIIAGFSYFRSHPSHLQLKAILDDPFDRCFVTALVRGQGHNTVILLHHHDIVDTDDYGAWREYAFFPDKITEILRTAALPEKARQDMDSGQWLFGRGVMDMKAGAALQIALLHDFSASGSFSGNLLLLSVPGEESNSEGMLAAVPVLNQLARQYDLDYVAVVNSEPQTTGDEERFSLVTGSIGKLLPLFYCFGKETHASKPFEGLSSSLLFSRIETLMEDNIELCDRALGEISPPPVNLSVKDLRTRYNITTPQVTAGYYNVFSMERSVGETMEILKNIARRAFMQAIAGKRDKAREYAGLAGKDIPQAYWQPNVYTYAELYQAARAAGGEEFERRMEFFRQKLRLEEKEERKFTIRMMDEVHNFCPDRNPKIVIAFAPPYYPHIVNRARTPKERHLLAVTDRLKNYARNRYGLDFAVDRMFNGITDLSYCGLEDSENVLAYLRPNMPAIGQVYDLPLEELKKLDMAVINVGPVGRDAHKFTERLHKAYFERIAPALLKFAVAELLKFPSDA